VVEAKEQADEGEESEIGQGPPARHRTSILRLKL
jgi:hypothetical protein